MVSKTVLELVLKDKAYKNANSNETILQWVENKSENGSKMATKMFTKIDSRYGFFLHKKIIKFRLSGSTNYYLYRFSGT